MHICPGCNRELDDPDYVQPERADPLLGSMPWQNRLGDEHAVLEPVCPCGKRMRNWIIGEYRVLSPVVSSLRGIALGLCVIAIAAVIDEGRRRQGSDFAAAVPLAIAGFAACGAYALRCRLRSPASRHVALTHYGPDCCGRVRLDRSTAWLRGHME